jgi:uncharacterized protein
MSRYMGFLLTGVLAVAGVVLLAWMFQRTLIYFPFSETPTPGQVGLTQVEEVEFPTADGVTLNGWFVRSASSAPTFTVVVFNGNAGNRAYRAPLAASLQRQGVQVLLFDYRGYGGNEGRPTEAGLRADAGAARTYLLGRGDVDASRLIYLGESLGTALAITLAAEHPPAGVILRSPFTSLVDVGRIHYPILPVRLLLDDVPRIRCPVLVIAGDQDRIIPVDQSRQVYDATRSAKELVVVKGAGHNDIELLAGDEMMAAIVRFLRDVAATVASTG